MMLTKQKFIKQKLIAFSAAGVILLMPVGAAYAADPFAPFIALFASYFEQLTAYLAEFSIPNIFVTLQNEAQQAISSSLGALGIPNPNGVRQALEQLITGSSTPDFFNSNRTSRIGFEANEADRQSARAGVDAILGDQGQQNTADSVDLTNSIVLDSYAAAVTGTALGPGVCQLFAGYGGCYNLPSYSQVTALLAQTSLSTQLMAGQRTDNLIAQQNQQWNTLINSEISESIDEQNRADQSRSTANSVRVQIVSESSTLF
jgi:hypothetical protein